MKNKMKHILILVCAFTMIVSNSIIAFADDTYTHTIEYSMSDGTRFRYTFTTTLGNCVLVKDSVRYGQYAYGYVNGEAVDITDSQYLVGNMVGYVDREGNGNFTYLRETTEISFPYAYEVMGIDVYGTIDEYVTYMRANEPEEPSTEELTEPEEPSTEEPAEPEEPSTEEQSTTPPSSEEPPTENIDYGIASNLVSDLIGNTKEFTPQSVMAIFVVCLVLECLSHIASALLSVGGMK